MAQRRRTYTRRKKANPLAWILVIVLLVGAAYIGAAGQLGTWLAENVIQPVFVTLGIFSPVESTQPTGTRQPSVSVSVSGFTVYGLQTGVYANDENAEQAAQTLQQQGGAGYLRKDGDNTRVMLSVYASESEALEVRDQLADTMETRLYPIVCTAQTISVYTEQQAKDLKAVLVEVEPVREALLDASLHAVDAQIGAAKLQNAYDLLSAFKTDLAASVPAGQSVFVDTLDSACQQALSLLSQAMNATDAQTRSHCVQSATLYFCFGYLDSLAVQ